VVHVAWWGLLVSWSAGGSLRLGEVCDAPSSALPLTRARRVGRLSTPPCADAGFPCAGGLADLGSSPPPHGSRSVWVGWPGGVWGGPVRGRVWRNRSRAAVEISHSPLTRRPCRRRRWHKSTIVATATPQQALKVPGCLGASPCCHAQWSVRCAPPCQGTAAPPDPLADAHAPSALRAPEPPGRPGHGPHAPAGFWPARPLAPRRPRQPHSGPTRSCPTVPGVARRARATPSRRDCETPYSHTGDPSRAVLGPRASAPWR
jgi:hypothetical protein